MQKKIFKMCSKRSQNNSEASDSADIPLISIHTKTEGSIIPIFFGRVLKSHDDWAADKFSKKNKLLISQRYTYYKTLYNYVIQS